MVREVGNLSIENSSIEHLASKIAADDGIQVEDLPNKDDLKSKHRTSIISDDGIHMEDLPNQDDLKSEHRSSIISDDGIQMEDFPSKHRTSTMMTTDDESGFSESITASARSSPVQTITEEDYELASKLSDDVKKEFCSDMCLVFHAEFQLTFGRYFTEDQWILMPLKADGTCKLPADTLCDVEIAKVRFECDACGHCWTSMRGQISFFYDCKSHMLYFKLFTQNCDQCGELTHPLWYPEEVCRVIKNVFVIVQQHVYPELQTPITSNHYRRFGNPKGQHHGCESCRDGVCVALAAQQLGCKLVK